MLLLNACAPVLPVPTPAEIDDRKLSRPPAGKEWVSDAQEDSIRAMAKSLVRQTPDSCEGIGHPLPPSSRYSFSCAVDQSIYPGIYALSVQSPSRPGDRVDAEFELDSRLCANMFRLQFDPLFEAPVHLSDFSTSPHGGPWGAFAEFPALNARFVASGTFDDSDEGARALCVDHFTVIRW